MSFVVLFCVVLSVSSLCCLFSVDVGVKLRKVHCSLSEVEAKTVKKPSLNRSAKDHRNTLFRVLDGVISLSHKKIHIAGNSDKAKQGWARVLVSAVSTYGSLLKDEELEFRVIALEEKLKNSILIPKPQADTKKARADGDRRGF
jgi:hypothetical protein